MKQMRYLGLLFAAVICCGAGQSEIPALLQEAQLASPAVTKKIADKILAIDPNSGDGYALEGFVKYSAKDIPGAIKDLTKAISLHPKDKFYLRSALNYRYHCYIALNDWKKALADCVECLTLEHSFGVANDAALLCKKTGDDQGFTKYQQLASQYKTAEQGHMMAIMDKVNATHDPTKVDGVLKQLEDHLRKVPDDLQAVTLRASCYETKGQYDKACKDLSRLIAAKPTLWPIYVQRAEVYQKAGNKQKAEEDLKKAKQLGYDPAKMHSVKATSKGRAD